MLQFYEHKVVDPKKTQDLINEQQIKILAYLMLPKLKKYYITIKVRGCVDERNQKNWLSKEDTSSPTVSTDGLMLSCTIGTMESQYVSNAEITVTFLQTDYDKG